MNYQESLSFITLFFLVLAAINSVRYRRKCTLLRNEHRFLENEKNLLAKECETLKGKVSKQLSFAADLSQAEVTTKLQMSRIGYHSCGYAASPPERYSYINSLAKQGMDAGEIASLLSISVQESEQLLALVKIGLKQKT